MGTAGALGHFLDEDRTVAVGASRRHGLVPRSKFTFGIFITTVENLAPARLPFFDVAFFTFGTLDAQIDWFLQRLNVFAFRIAAAAEELAEFTPAQKHGTAAFPAGFVDFF